MSQFIRFLGGAGELGANSVYLYLNGTGIVIDAGLHPKKRDLQAFPHFELIEDEPVDYLVLTHAHTDHIGALPYLLKFQPQVKIISTLPTCSLAEIMLKDTAKLLKSEINQEFPAEALSLYSSEHLEKIWMLLDGYKYFEKINIKGMQGLSDVGLTFYPSGHILGAASVLIESNSYSILHTGDIQFSNQAVLAGAKLPDYHLDCLITESTNAGNEGLPAFKDETKRLAKYINKIVDGNGSLLIPAFVLGKTQEILKVLYDLIRKGSIPNLPVYTTGLGRKISRLYDKFCYNVPMINPGFEISDIPQIAIKKKELHKGDYLREPSVVVVPSGMMNENTFSYTLAKQWASLKNFGIAFIGYLDENSPGAALFNSEKDKEFPFGTKLIKRKCEVESFRFSSHASLEDLSNYIISIKPNKLFIVHGEQESAEYLAEKVYISIKNTQIILPEMKKSYKLL